MKKVVIGYFLLFIFIGISFAVQDQYGSERPPLWRSSSTCQSIPFVVLATGPVHIHSIKVDSGTVISGNGNSFVSIFNSTTSATASNTNNFISTPVFTNTWAPSNVPISRPAEIFDVPLGSGAVVSKQGVDCVTIYWDYIKAHYFLGAPFYPYFPYGNH